ncbi:SDR family oxidoreductase [Arthrobacter sp. NPDC056727]|uniref:SDR family oxidoreductase n=1 Tax=Arthrobacter sp. NPDC056727 TaxID=3345927 RepID=UPI003670D2CE
MGTWPHVPHPVGRVGRPTDVRDLAVFLASDRSSFLTGEVVVLDGGRTAKLPLPLWRRCFSSRWPPAGMD